MIQDIMDFLSQADPEVGASIQKEFDREQHNIEPVSYTHLDVYKRQVPIWGASKAAARRALAFRPYSIK